MTATADDGGSAARAPTGRKRIKVLQLSYGSTLYGAERWVLALIRHLDPERVETVVGCILDADGPDLPLLDEAKRLGFETVVIEATRSLIGRSVRGIRSLVRRLGIDVIHTHGVRQDVLGRAAVVGLPCRTVSTPHGWEGRPSLKERVYAVIDKLAFASFDAVAPLSPDLAASIRSYPIPRSRIHLIPNGVDLSEIESAAPAALPWDGGPPVFSIGYIGRLTSGKGVHVLIDALRGLNGADWRCLIVGEGPERATLEARAAGHGLGDRVIFLGYRPDRLSYLKRFDFFVLPSIREGIPRCLMEALAAGIPCAGSRIPGIDMVLQDGVTGRMFPAGDAEALGTILRRALVDRARELELARAGQALIHERFSARAMARGYEDLYERILAGRGRPAGAGG
jgi:glycosyltransferase involved in cell wall biosynthesis